MYNKVPLIIAFGLLSLTYSCKKDETGATSNNGITTKTHNAPSHRWPTARPGPPNIIFVLADDMGYEMPTFDGGSSYNTTHLDSLAANSMVFNQCHGTPLCSPSRVELLSGLYNFRNYLTYGWGHYDGSFITYPTVLEQNGYKTCVVGKWQLANYVPGITTMGFDNYCIRDDNGYMYRSPIIYQDGSYIKGAATNNQESEDIVGNYAYKFIDENKDKPFFMYYSFSLIHQPDQPTPLDANFLSFDENVDDTTYIPSMTHYMDIKVGQLINKLKADGLENNTIIVFTGDNGSMENYHSIFRGQMVRGEKGFTVEFGTHVPMFVYWPGHIKPGSNDNLVDFIDFAPTFLDMANVTDKPTMDGVSFYQQCFGLNTNVQQARYGYFNPFPIPGQPRAQTTPITYAQDTAYKLYKTDAIENRAGKFYHFTKDLGEYHPLSDSQLTPAQVAEKLKLQAVLNGMP
jgi:arylsulfatase A